MAQTIEYHGAGGYEGRLPDDPPSWSQRLIRAALAIGWITAAALAAILIGALAGAMTIPPAVAIGPAVVLVAVMAILHIARSVRRRRADMVLSYLEQAVRMNLPLPWMLAAAEDQERGTLRRRIAHLRQTIEAGGPVGAALQMTVPELSPRAARLTRAAEHLGRLSGTLRQIVEQERRRRQVHVGDRAFAVSYPVMMVLAIACIVASLMIFVGPKFAAIYRDFRIEPAGAMTIILRVIFWLGIPAALVAGFVALLFLVRAMGEIFVPRLVGTYGRFNLTDELIWFIPVASGIVRDRGLSDVFQIAGDALEGGYPLHQALLEADGLQLNRVLRGRINAWRMGMETGLSPGEAARSARMPRLVVGLLGTATVSASAAPMFRFLSQYYADRRARTLALVYAVLIPTMTLFFGVVVAAVELSVFLPMLKLLDKLMPMGGIL